MVKTGRISVLGLMKFLSSVIIMHYHFYAWDNHRFGAASILVEFFFMITGYFTYSHFRKIKSYPSTNEEKAKVGVSYTFRKIKTLYPFIVAAIIFGILVNFAFAKDFSYIIGSLKAGLAELFLLTPLFDYQRTPINGVTWFLGVMAIVMPLFIFFIQTKARTLLMIVFTFASLLILSFRPNYTTIVSGTERCVMCFMLGAIIYELAQKIQKRKMTKMQIGFLNVAEFLLIVGQFTVLFFTNRTSLSSEKMLNYVFVMTVFFLNLMLLFSGKTVFSRIDNRFLNYLEKISMVIYLSHVPFLTIIDYAGWRGNLKITLLFEVAVIIYSVVLYGAISYIRKKMAAKKNLPSKSRR